MEEQVRGCQEALASVTQVTPNPFLIGMKQRLSETQVALLRSPDFQRLIKSGSRIKGRDMDI